MIWNNGALISRRTKLVQIDSLVLQVVILLNLDILKQIWHLNHRHLLTNLLLGRLRHKLLVGLRSLIGVLRGRRGARARLRYLRVVIGVCAFDATLFRQRHINVGGRKLAVLFEHFVVAVGKGKRRWLVDGEGEE